MELRHLRYFITVLNNSDGCRPRKQILFTLKDFLNPPTIRLCFGLALGYSLPV